MKTQMDGCSLRGWAVLLLLQLVCVAPPSAAQVYTYQEAVLRAVDGLNQRSSDASLYRLLFLGPEPQGDDNPYSPKPVSFTVKETVCPRTTQRPVETCDFKENGLEKQCVGTVILDQATGSFDISCDQRVKRIGFLRNLFQKGIEKIRKIGQRIKDFFQ
ncbi:cathelicidin antimicrobial peptide-like [Tenrec ecaudatus]|uniref:cathelicidin antimicrobial peptide-like n=1 Tax=Tenrec ecaudatus TaxID=94439 RepID=UPI003F59FA84